MQKSNKDANADALADKGSQRLTRRRVLEGAGMIALTSLTGLTAGRPARAQSKWRLGVQSYSFRQFATAQAVAKLKELGLDSMEFYPGHFPPLLQNEKTLEAREILRSTRTSVPAYGVLGFDEDAAKSRTLFRFAKELGIEILSADPSPDSFDSLEDLAQEFDIAIAIHNHGPGHRYATLDDLISATQGRDRRIGICLDTGHALRSGQKPQQMLEALGDRVHSVHLKDWITGGEEQVLGEGDLDLEAVAETLHSLDFSGPVSLEYELDPDDPVPAMRRGLANWETAAGSKA